MSEAPLYPRRTSSASRTPPSQPSPLSVHSEKLFLSPSILRTFSSHHPPSNPSPLTPHPHNLLLSHPTLTTFFSHDPHSYMPPHGVCHMFRKSDASRHWPHPVEIWRGETVQPQDGLRGICSERSLCEGHVCYSPLQVHAWPHYSFMRGAVKPLYRGTSPIRKCPPPAALYRYTREPRWGGTTGSCHSRFAAGQKSHSGHPHERIWHT